MTTLNIQTIKMTADQYFELGEDPPGVRRVGTGEFYLAYLRDPDGNKLVIHKRKA